MSRRRPERTSGVGPTGGPLSSTPLAAGEGDDHLWSPPGPYSPSACGRTLGTPASPHPLRRPTVATRASPCSGRLSVSRILPETLVPGTVEEVGALPEDWWPRVETGEDSRDPPFQTFGLQGVWRNEHPGPAPTPPPPTGRGPGPLPGCAPKRHARGRSSPERTAADLPTRPLCRGAT